MPQLHSLRFRSRFFLHTGSRSVRWSVLRIIRNGARRTAPGWPRRPGAALTGIVALAAPLLTAVAAPATHAAAAPATHASAPRGPRPAAAAAAGPSRRRCARPAADRRAAAGRRRGAGRRAVLPARHAAAWRPAAQLRGRLRLAVLRVSGKVPGRRRHDRHAVRGPPLQRRARRHRAPPGGDGDGHRGGGDRTRPPSPSRPYAPPPARSRRAKVAAYRSGARAVHRVRQRAAGTPAPGRTRSTSRSAAPHYNSGGGAARAVVPGRPARLASAAGAAGSSTPASWRPGGTGWPCGPPTGRVIDRRVPLAGHRAARARGVPAGGAGTRRT